METVEASLRWLFNGHLRKNYSMRPCQIVGDHTKSCCFSVLNGSPRASADFMLVPKLPGETQGAAKVRSRSIKQRRLGLK